MIFNYFSKGLPTAEEVLNFKFDTGSEVFDSNGRLIHMYAFEHRKLVDLSEVPQYMLDMLIEIEDKNFYKHWGLDVYGIFRAMMINIKTRSTSQGASTISQQLARNMFLTTERMWSRKIKEAILAVMIERHFTKQEILESYLNKVLFGNGYYGIETASMNYFLKNSSELTIAESALLVGLLKGSGYYNPLRYPERALTRRNLILEIAYDNGIISQEDYEKALLEPLKVNRQGLSRNKESDYFIEYIRPYLERKYGTNQLFTGGLKIYTTIDYDLQQYADSVMNKVLIDLDESRKYKNKYKDVPEDAVNIKTEYLQGGVFGIEAHTGYVKVMIGGRNFKHSKYNRVMQARRQPGSSFKPFVYTTAINNGFTAATIVVDEPLVFMKDRRVFWEPKNFTREFLGHLRLREALQKSINIVAAKIIYDVGPDKVVELMEKFNLRTKISPYLSISVGACEMIPCELVTSYTIFPGRGDVVEPIYITKVTDSRGKILEQATIRRRPVIDRKTAYIMTDMLRSVVDEGTAATIRNRGFRMPAGGKTGTTDDYKDAWFVGFTKNFVLGTWTGFDDNTTMGRNMTGATAALPIWIPIMRYYEKKLEESGANIHEEFDRPQGIVKIPVSRRTGLLPSTPYEPTLMESFIEYTEPYSHSDLFIYNYYPATHFRTIEENIV
jgi:penicillin-binding protein 1A